MNGLTSRQAWTLEHITRCTCGSWTVTTEWQAKSAAPYACPHINAAAMEKTA